MLHKNASEFPAPILSIKAHILQHILTSFTKRATDCRVQCINHDKRLIHTLFASIHSLLHIPRFFTCLPFSSPMLNRAVASFPRASLGGSSRGRDQPSSDPVSKAGGGNREGGRGRRWEVEQLQHRYAHTAAPCEHAGGCHPFVAAWVVFLDGVETGAAIVASDCV